MLDIKVNLNLGRLQRLIFEGQDIPHDHNIMKINVNWQENADHF
jgi:hypothetical protein